MGKHLVLVGGGHAHLTTILRLEDYIRRGHHVTLISADAYHYYSGMGPGMLAGIYRPQDIRFHIKKMSEDRGAVFLEDRAVKIDPAQHVLHLQSGKQLSYDVVSFNTGSDVPKESLDGSGERIFTVKPIINLLRARKYILEHIESGPLNIVVIGGGPAGVEVAGNAWRLVYNHHGTARITLIAGQRLFRGLPEKVRSLAMDSLSSRRIEVLEDIRATKIEQESIKLSNGRTLSFDIAFIASGVRPSSLFRDSGLPTGEDGGLLVNANLQSIAHPEIFGGGDCISLEGHHLPKVGVYAVRENEILHHNLCAALDGRAMRTFEPQKIYLLIFNMGNGKGIFWRNNLVWDGRTAFSLKNYIDNRFMKKFQVSGEREEE
ncbi:MAG: NAD(P)/FAD-dependent oxidoreductase [Nitrospirota bacterium]